MVTVNIYSPNVNVDRYHLLNYGDNPTDQEIIYTETGDAFNGFDRVIVNCNLDVISDSRLCSLILDNFNNNEKIYFLITEIRPLTATKSIIEIDYDVWMNKRDKIRIGEQNYLYETSKFMAEYPYSDIDTKEYYFDFVTSMFPGESQFWDFVILYHDSMTNEDFIYWALSNKNAFEFYSLSFWQILANLGIDSNSIISVYLSPFELEFQNISIWTDVYTSNDLVIKKAGYSAFCLSIDSQYSQYELNYYFISDPKEKTVITDMAGAIVWTTPANLNGFYKVTIYPDITYSSFVWHGYVNVDTIETRFSIQCVDMGFIADYYQQYQNLQKSYNADIRQAQLDKQLYQNLGNIVSSGVNAGVMGSIGGSAKLGAAGGIAGSAVNTAVDYLATSDYNRKLEKIEDKQAKLQYDVISANLLSFASYIKGLTVPGFYIKKSDPQSLFSIYDSDTGYKRIRYNCRINRASLINLITIDKPMFLSGDFDFIGISERDAIQLNLRFKAGVNFVPWTGTYGG